MTHTVPVTAIALALAASACAFAQPSTEAAIHPTTSSPPPEFHALVEAARAEHAIPAFGAAYVEAGQLVWAGTWGAQEDALFNVASLAKPVAAESILRLASDGLIDLEAPMAEHYIDPDIVEDPRAQALTLQLALTHRTGLPNWRDGQLAFQFDPGTRPVYSGEGYEYAGAYTQAVTGEDFKSLVEREVIAAAGAHGDMSIGADETLDDRRLAGHDADGNSTGVSLAAPWSAADDLWTTPRGYGLFLASKMRGDGLNDAIAAERHVISFDQAPFACTQGPLVDFCPNALGFGMGVARFEYDTDTFILQGGGDAGEAALMFYSEQTGRGLVLMSNSVNGRKAFPALAATVTDNADFLRFLQMQAGG